MPSATKRSRKRRPPLQTRLPAGKEEADECMNAKSAVEVSQVDRAEKCGPLMALDHRQNSQDLRRSQYMSGFILARSRSIVRLYLSSTGVAADVGFSGEECGRPFTVASNLRRHQKIHAKQSRNHANDVSNLIFKRMSPNLTLLTLQIGPALTIQESESSTIKQPPAARLKMDLTPVPASDEEDAGEEPLDVDEEVESMYEADAASLSSRGSDPLARTPSLDSSASGASHSSTRKMPVTAF